MTRRVLVVEDDHQIRDIYKLALESEGYEVVCAAHGREALELLTRIPSPAVILLDLMMPVMDGWAFAAELEGTAFANIPVIVVSAFHHAAKPIKADRFLQKPVDLDEFLAVVGQYMTSGT